MHFCDLCNSFLTSKQHLVDTRELSPSSFRDYHNTCSRLVEVFGRSRLVDDLAAGDFETLRRSLSSTRGPVALGNEIQRVRSVFKYGYEAGVVDTPIRFGPGFKKPNRRMIRQARHANGPRMFEAGELRTIIDSAPQPLRAMTLLGINAGFGQSDIGSLSVAALDLDGGYVNHPRPKTVMPRRCPLWSETVGAIREVLECGQHPRDDADRDIAFLTTQGRRWSRVTASGSPVDCLGHEFAKLLRRLGLKREKVSFYALRHTTETIGGEAKDQVALDHIMGHVRGDMASVYRERISDDRLKAVTDTVHAWLFGDVE